jgi:sterol desaturase/sphingolipid hydroxylase (fatty acid hydroxylase superfamily)
VSPLQSLPHALPGYRPWLLTGLIVVLGAATLEGLIKTWWLHQHYDWRGFAASLVDAVLRRLVSLLGWSVAAPAVAWAFEHRLTTLTVDTPLALLALFIGQEFCYYWFHRCAHRVRWFWATHAVHHSPNQLTWASALRLGATGDLTGTGLFFVPLVWLGFAPQLVLACVALNLVYQFWLHATWIPKLGPLEWVLNTPSHHRAHHGSNTIYLDRNFGGVLIVFDRLFGTFAQERQDEPPRYGLTTPLLSHNPLYIAVHEWCHLGRDLRTQPGWRAKLRVLFGPPA